MNGSIQVQTNFIPSFKIGYTPTVNQIQQSVQYFPYSSSFCDPNAETINDSNTYTLNFPIHLPDPTQPSVQYKPVGGGPISYQLSNSALFAAADATGQDPISKECVNSFGTHVPSDGICHGHSIDPCLIDYTTKPLLTGWYMDGYPCISPFVIQVDEQPTHFPYVEKDGKYYRMIQSSDLDRNNGLSGQFTVDISIQGVVQTLSYPYAYICTNDRPYTLSAYVGSIKLINQNIQQFQNH